MENIEKEPISIMQAIPDDAESICKMRMTVWLATYPNETFAITKEDIEEKLKSTLSPAGIEKTRSKIIESVGGNSMMFVAKAGSTPIGFCLCVKTEEYNQLQAIYILPEFQGKGIGKQLWEKAMTFFGGNDKKIIVHVATYNQNAIDFYKNLGFVDTGKTFSDEQFRMKNGSIIPETELVIERK